MSLSNNNADFEKESERVLKEQKKIYDKLDFRKVFLDKKEVIRHFIESEDVARKYAFQGRFYYMAHYEIHKIVKTKMSAIDEKDIITTFYHLLRLGCTPKILENNFEYLQKAMCLLLPDLVSKNHLICNLDRRTAFILFGVKNELDEDAILNTKYENYCNIIDFNYKCNTYNYMENMLKKKDSFIPFLTNSVLFERIKKGVVLFSDKAYHQNMGFNFGYGGFLIMLLISTDPEAKDALRQVHKQNLTANLVWVLGTFYKEFQNSEANKELLVDLYETFPHDWINEYQEKKYDWQNY